VRKRTNAGQFWGLLASAANETKDLKIYACNKIKTNMKCNAPYVPVATLR